MLDIIGGGFIWLVPEIGSKVGLQPNSIIMNRFFGAALLAIGTISWLASSYKRPSQFADLLTEKMVWSFFVSVGILFTWFQEGSLPLVVWLLLGVFLIGFITWTIYCIIIGRMMSAMK